MKHWQGEFTDEIKLRLLQSAGGVRPWGSLDEICQCVLCERTFSGREVRLICKRGHTPRLHCPTRGCAATPAQWIHPGNPLVSEDAWQDWVHLLDKLCEHPCQTAVSEAV